MKSSATAVELRPSVQHCYIHVCSAVEWRRKLCWQTPHLFMFWGHSITTLTRWGGDTVCWIGVKVAVLCARQYMSWNIFLIKVLNNFWYFEHRILTMIYSKPYLKHNWKKLPLKRVKRVQFLKTISSIMLQICFWESLRRDVMFEISKIIQNFD